MRIRDLDTRNTKRKMRKEFRDNYLARSQNMPRLRDRSGSSKDEHYGNFIREINNFAESVFPDVDGDEQKREMQHLASSPMDWGVSGGVCAGAVLDMAGRLGDKPVDREKFVKIAKEYQNGAGPAAVANQIAYKKVSYPKKYAEVKTEILQRLLDGGIIKSEQQKKIIDAFSRAVSIFLIADREELDGFAKNFDSFVERYKDSDGIRDPLIEYIKNNELIPEGRMKKFLMDNAPDGLEKSFFENSELSLEKLHSCLPDEFKNSLPEGYENLPSIDLKKEVIEKICADYKETVVKGLENNNTITGKLLSLLNAEFKEGEAITEKKLVQALDNATEQLFNAFPKDCREQFAKDFLEDTNRFVMAFSPKIPNLKGRAGPLSKAFSGMAGRIKAVAKNVFQKKQAKAEKKEKLERSRVKNLVLSQKSSLVNEGKMNKIAEKRGLKYQSLGDIGISAPCRGDKKDEEYLDAVLSLLPKGRYSMNIRLKGRAHAIMLAKEEDGVYLWDPNYGLFACDRVDPKQTILQVLGNYSLPQKNELGNHYIDLNVIKTFQESDQNL